MPDQPVFLQVVAQTKLYRPFKVLAQANISMQDQPVLHRIVAPTKLNSLFKSWLIETIISIVPGPKNAKSARYSLSHGSD